MAILRTILLLLAILAGGALAGLLVGWFVGMPGHWYFWAGGGAVVLGIAIALVLWNLMSRGGNIIASALLACVVAVGMLQPGPARADLVMHNRDHTSTMHLLQTSCSHGETLALLKPEVRAEFRNLRILSATGVIAWYGCWWRAADGDIFVILSDGASMRLPASNFQESSI